MDTLVPTLVVLAVPVVMIAMGIGFSKLHDRRRRRQWESGKYGAARFGAGAAGGATYLGSGGACAAGGGGASCGGGPGCSGGGCGGGGCGGGGCGGGG